MISVVEQVNRLIRYHGHETNEPKTGNKMGGLKMAKAVASKIGNKAVKNLGTKFFEEDKNHMPPEEEKRSFRGPREEMKGEPMS